MKYTVGTIALIVGPGYEYEGEPKLDLIEEILKGICGVRLDWCVCAGRKNGDAAIRVELYSNAPEAVARREIKGAAKKLADALFSQGVVAFNGDTELIN